MQKFKYYFFDWDGCLANSLAFWLKAYGEIFEKHSVFPQNKEIIHKVFGKPLGPADFGIEDPYQFKEEVHALVRSRMVRDLELHKGVKEILYKLQEKGKKLAIATSSKRSNIQKILEREEIEDWFDVIVTADDVTNVKPDPEMILKILNFFKADKTEAIMIGDSDVDIKAGKAAGIATVAFYPKANEQFYDRKFLENEQPDYIIKDLNEFL